MKKSSIEKASTMRQKDFLYNTNISRALIRLLLICLTVLTMNTWLQAQDSTFAPPDIHVDSTMMQKLQALGKKEAEKSIADFKIDRSSQKQEILFQQIKNTTQRAFSRLKAGLDSIRIEKDLDNIADWMNIAGRGVFVDREAYHTIRNLTTTTKLLEELKIRNDVQLRQVEQYVRDLHHFKFQLDSLNADSVLYDFPKNEAALRQYVGKIWLLAKEIKPADSALQKAIIQTEGLFTRVRLMNTKLLSELEELEIYQQQLASKTFGKDILILSSQPSYGQPLTGSIDFSWQKARLMLRFYLSNHAGKLMWLVFLIFVMTVFLNSVKKILREKQQLKEDYSGQLVLKYPFVSALLLGLSLFQFIFPAPPFIFNFILWTIVAISLTVIFYKFVDRFWLLVWSSFLLLFLAVGADNLILQASGTDRKIMLILSALGLIVSLLSFYYGRGRELKEKPILYFIGLVVIMELMALLFNVSGRYNFSKTLMTLGYVNVIIGVIFLWNVRLINEGLFLASKAYTSQSSKLFYINFDIVGARVPRIFYALLFAGWVILMGRNFYSFHFVTDPIKDFFVADRTVGNYTFTIYSVLIFFIIMAIAVVVSKIVSFFATDKHSYHGTGNSKSGNLSGVGSWLLLIRISIISTGLFLAFAATGMPFDRITLVLGAIGVGVGLGLQALVNNLVSGLILAFERPVNVGDLIEIKGQAGTMKSIGFRSSVISKGDGADIIMPNGDLLNSQLVNRSLSGRRRMLELSLPMAHGTDIEELRKLLHEALASNEKILTTPPPQILVNSLTKYGIELKLLFWIPHFSLYTQVKSDVLTTLYQSFGVKGIAMSAGHDDISIDIHHSNISPEDIEGGKNKIEK